MATDLLLLPALVIAVLLFLLAALKRKQCTPARKRAGFYSSDATTNLAYSILIEEFQGDTEEVERLIVYEMCQSPAITRLQAINDVLDKQSSETLQRQGC